MASTRQNISEKKTLSSEKKGRKSDKIVEIPEKFLCPLTKQVSVICKGDTLQAYKRKIFYNPVCTVDGHCFEFEVINRWLFIKNQDTNPVTGMQLKAKILVPNNFAKNAIKEFLAENPEMKDEVYLPMALRRDAITAVRTNDVPLLAQCVVKDRRILTHILEHSIQLLY
jgi:hypothetical protein